MRCAIAKVSVSPKISLLEDRQIMMKRLLLASLFAAGSTMAFAQDGDDTVEEMASEEETQMVQETLSKIGCEASSVEKESDNLFEVDDATCEIGQYDIKLDGEYRITVMSIDE
ncbi:hypothetical protein FP2506_08456 [Fulvimarina pelagi HTCC2506]|uniref:PepSY domain-containing protein n=2 Tax=Fulvimarina pelagi TaxID=217511 RepID=Q0G655_9HYPH|nr:hypothetical protein FP2506_08456 [Fulvimarina pelagi HTCC2506]